MPLIIRWVALQQVHSFWDLSVRKSCLLSRSGSVKTHRTTNYLDIKTCSSTSAEFITAPDAPSASAVINNFHLLHQNFFSILFFLGGEKPPLWSEISQRRHLGLWQSSLMWRCCCCRGQQRPTLELPLLLFLQYLIVFKLENSGMVTALITTQSSIFICRLSFCVVSSEELDKLIWWLMFINQNETDPRPEMPTGRAIIFLNAPVRFQKCTRLCWHVVRGKRRFGEFKRRQTG